MNRREDDYRDEIREHMEMEYRDNLERGMAPAEARRAAELAFGNSTVVFQRLREGGPFFWLDTLFQDVRYGLRLLRRSPLVACATVLTLTLGIGINTGVFTVLSGIMMKPRVEQDPASFAHLAAMVSEDGQRPEDSRFSLDQYRAYAAEGRSVRELAAWGVGNSPLDNDDAVRWLIMLTTCNYFSVYGLQQPRLGRIFRPEECASPGSAPVAVLSEELWRSRFGADPNILGAVLRLNHQPFTVIGITPARFSGQIKGPGIWVPYTMQKVFYGGRDLFRESAAPWLTVEGRLAAGQTRATAQAELTVIARRLDRLRPGRQTNIVVTNGAFIEEPSQRVQVLWVATLIVGALTLILLLACTNVTMLLLSRAAARRREIAIRLSLGAGRVRLLRMLLTESLILAGTAGAISAWVAAKVPSTMEKLVPGMPHYPLAPDLLVFAYLAAVTLLAGVMAGAAPAAESLKADLTASLKGNDGLYGGRSRTRGFLIGVQVALSLVLLAGAGLFVRAEYTIFSRNPGFETRHVLLVPLRLPLPPYTPASASAFYRSLEQRVREVPGIDAAGFATSPPFFNDEGAPTEEVRLPGRAKGAGLRAAFNIVSPGFFDTLGIPIVRGRAFREGEVPAKGAPDPVIVSEALARAMWPAADPLGQVLQDADGDPLQVAGVAPDVMSLRFGAVDGPVLYRLRNPRAYGDPLLLRFHGEAQATQLALRDLIRGMDREMLPRLGTLQSTMDNFADLFWRMAEMVLFLGAVAMVLAVTGIYGVVAFAVSRRTREMGIRMALGATRGNIVRSVVAGGARPILAGLLAGLLLALAGAAALSRALQVTPIAVNVRDPLPYAVVVLLLAATAFAATFGPAWRASRADPSQTLRQD